tara:strand:+ start:1035 stop:2795 length:1761 start_codon:yes stop_codon:yes gene_type:complete
MASLANNTIASTYPLLLKVDSNGIDGDLRTIEDGDGTDTALKVSTGAIQVDNIKVDGNTISSTDTDGNIALSPNGSGAVTVSSLSTSGNIGLGVTPETWHSGSDAIQGANFSLSSEAAAGAGKSITLAYNQYIDSGNAWTYINADEASYYQQYNGAHYFATAPAGSADGDVTNTNKLTIANDGTSTFANKVTIDNDAAEHLTLKRDGSHWWDIQVGSNGNLNIQKNGAADTLIIDGSGNATFSGDVVVKSSGVVACFGDADARDSDAAGQYGAGCFQYQFQNGSATRGAVLELGGDLNAGEIMGGLAFFRSGNGTNMKLRASVEAQLTSESNPGGKLKFTTAADAATQPSVRMLINEDGKVAIGHSSPTYGLDVISGSGIKVADNASNNRCVWGTSGGNYAQFMYDSSNNQKVQIATGTISYFTGGNVYIGTTTAVGAGTEGIEFRSDYGYFKTGRNSTGSVGHWLIINANGEQGSVTTTASATQFNTSSDYRLKENQVAISDGLTRLNQLKPYRFNFKVDKDTTVDGFFAHEVSSIVPEAITGEKDAVDSDGNIKVQQIDQAKLVPLLVAAVQELSAKVTALESA